MADTTLSTAAQAASAGSSQATTTDHKAQLAAVRRSVEKLLQDHSNRLYVIESTIKAFKLAVWEHPDFEEPPLNLLEAIEQLLPDDDARHELRANVVEQIEALQAPQHQPTASAGVPLHVVAMLLRVARGAGNHMEAFVATRNLCEHSEAADFGEVWAEQLSALEQQGLEVHVQGGPSGSVTLKPMQDGDPRRKVFIADAHLADVIRTALRAPARNTATAELKAICNHLAAAYSTVTPTPMAMVEFSAVLNAHGLEGFYDQEGRIELRKMDRPERAANAEAGTSAPVSRARAKRARRENLAAA